MTLTLTVEVSVVVPCYKCVNTVARSVASIAAQTRIPRQIVLVDDGSPDDGETLTELHRLREVYAGVLSIELIALPENLGVAGARNAGWELATQPYIAFLDADDAWHSRKLELQLDHMKRYPDIVLCGHGHRILQDDSLPDWDVPMFVTTVVSKRDMLMSNRFNPSSAMVKTDTPYRFMQGRRYMEDHLLWLEIVCDGRRVERLNVDLGATYKQPYGDSGLSANLWQMERFDLDNYRLLCCHGKLSAMGKIILQCFSLLKFLRRVLMIILWRLHGGR